MYSPALKGKYALRPQPPQQANFGSEIGEVSLLLMQLHGLKQELNAKLQEVDTKIAQHLENVTQITNENIKATEILENTKEAIAEHISKVKQGDPGTPADEDAILERLKLHIPEPIDTKKLQKDILAQVPKIDTNKLTNQILKAIPQNKASLKIIQEQFTVDPLTVVEKIMELAKQGKFKLKKENIDGLEQTMEAFNSQLGRGYLHGGGDTVAAGTNITLTRNANGTTTISSTGGSGFTKLDTASTVDGSNQSFIFLTATAKPSLVVVDGIQLTALDNNGATQWSWNSGTKTVTLSTPPPINSIFAIQ